MKILRLCLVQSRDLLKALQQQRAESHYRATTGHQQPAAGLQHLPVSSAVFSSCCFCRLEPNGQPQLLAMCTGKRAGCTGICVFPISAQPPREQLPSGCSSFQLMKQVCPSHLPTLFPPTPSTQRECRLAVLAPSPPKQPLAPRSTSLPAVCPLGHPKRALWPHVQGLTAPSQAPCHWRTRGRAAGQGDRLKAGGTRGQGSAGQCPGHFCLPGVSPAAD